MKVFQKITALALCLTLLAGASGCNTSDTTWVYQSGDQSVPAGFYLTHQINSFFLAEGKFQEQENAPTDYKPKDVLAYDIDGQKADAWIQKEAKNAALQYLATATKAAELGVALDEAELASVQSTTGRVWSGEMANSVMQYAMYTGMTPEQYLLLLSQKNFEDNGISYSSLEQYFMDQSLAKKLFLHLYGEGGEYAVGEADIVAKFKESYTKAGYIVIVKQSVTGSEEDPVQAAADADAANQELKALAESYLVRLKAGEPLEDLEYEYSLSKAEAGAEVTKRAKSDLETIFYRNEESTGDVLTDTAASATEPVISEDSYGIYIVSPVDILGDSKDLDDYRSSLLSSLKWDEFEEKLMEWGAQLNPTANDTAFSKYTPSKLKFD